MAEIQSFRGEGDESVQGAIDMISWTGGSAIASSIDWYPSQQWTPVELVGI
jgi:hypothetical protein